MPAFCTPVTSLHTNHQSTTDTYSMHKHQKNMHHHTSPVAHRQSRACMQPLTASVHSLGSIPPLTPHHPCHRDWTRPTPHPHRAYHSTSVCILPSMQPSHPVLHCLLWIALQLSQQAAVQWYCLRYCLVHAGIHLCLCKTGGQRDPYVMPGCP